MRKGYIRLSKSGPRLEIQQAALRTAGVIDPEAIYIDEAPKAKGDEPLPARAQAITSLRPSDELVVQSPGRLGLSIDDTMKALAHIGRQEAALFDVESATSYEWQPQAAEIVLLAARAESQRRRENLSRVRQVAHDMGMMRGPATKLSAKKRREAKAAWSDVRFTAAQVSEQFGVPVRTLYAMLGPRGTPRFGGPGPHPRKST